MIAVLPMLVLACAERLVDDQAIYDRTPVSTDVVLDDYPVYDCERPDDDWLLAPMMNYDGLYSFEDPQYGFLLVYLEMNSALREDCCHSYADGMQEWNWHMRDELAAGVYIYFGDSEGEPDPLPLQGEHELTGTHGRSAVYYMHMRSSLNGTDAAATSDDDPSDGNTGPESTLCVSHVRRHRLAGTMWFDATQTKYWAEDFPVPIWFTFNAPIVPGVAYLRADRLTYPYTGDDTYPHISSTFFTEYIGVSPNEVWSQDDDEDSGR